MATTQQADTYQPVRHHLPFTARVTTCCGRPAKDFDRWDLVVNPANATCHGAASKAA